MDRIETPPHLGGGERQGHVDLPVLEYLVKRFGIKTMLDVGCGMGRMVDAARKVLGRFDVYGVDGDARVLPAFLHDYTTGRMVDAPPADLIWSMEFVEHVEEKYLPNILDTFRRGRVLFMTYAPPGKAGHHHVNCRSQEYWVDKMGTYGWALDKEATNHVRSISNIVTVMADGTRVEKGKRFTKDYGLVFTR